MKKSYCLCLLLVGLTACVSSRPGATVPPSAKEKSARGQLEQLERQLSTHVDVQSSLSNDVQKIHADLLSAAQELRDIKVRANALSLASESNRLAMAAVEQAITDQRNVVLQCEKEAMEEARKVAALNDALAAEKKAREQEATQAEQAKARAVEEETRKSAAVKEALTREQELRNRDQAILREREKQIEDLRKALEERDKLLRAGSVSTAAAVQPVATSKSSDAQPAAANDTAATKLTAQGNAQLRANQVDDAEKSFRDALAVNPDLVGARIGLAACLYTRANIKDAKKIIDDVLDEDSRNAQALGLSGLIAWREGDLSEATSVLQKAVRQDATDSQLQNYLGIVLFERKRVEPARAALRKAVELDPANGEAQFNLAVVLASGSDPQLAEAKDHYQRALELGSERDDALDKILNVAP